jgi:hypothetical protein
MIDALAVSGPAPAPASEDRTAGETSADPAFAAVIAALLTPAGPAQPELPIGVLGEAPTPTGTDGGAPAAPVLPEALIAVLAAPTATTAEVSPVDISVSTDEAPVEDLAVPAEPVPAPATGPAASAVAERVTIEAPAEAAEAPAEVVEAVEAVEVAEPASAPTAPAPVADEPPQPEAQPVRRPADSPASVANPAAAYVPSTQAPAAPVAPTAVAAPQSVKAPQVAEQVVSKIGPLVEHGDGTYELTLELQPAELGRVRVEVLVDHGRVSVNVQAQHATTGDVIREALPDLRAALEAAGLSAGDVLVGSGPAQDDPRPGTGDQDDVDGPSSEPAGGRDPEHGSRPHPLTASTSAVDLLL